MKVIVDTCVWLQALRRNTPEQNSHVKELQELIKETRVQLIGPIRQELLNGIKSFEQFTQLKQHLGTFKDISIQTEDYELAAEFFNIARSRGIQGSNTDFLICAVSKKNNIPVLTTDKDFINFESVLPVTLHKSRY